MFTSSIEYPPHSAPTVPVMDRAALVEALRSARAAGRPVFTAAALRRAIPAADDPRHASVLTEAATDLHAFLDNHFTLTDMQQDALARIDDLEIVRLQALLHRAAGRGSDVQMEVIVFEDHPDTVICALCVRPDGRVEEAFLELHAEAAPTDLQ